MLNDIWLLCQIVAPNRFNYDVDCQYLPKKKKWNNRQFVYLALYNRNVIHR